MSPEETPFRVMSLADEEAVPISGGTLDWIPLRRRLGIQAFGTNAYRATRAGDQVIEEHVESPGQEEMYVVVAGRIRMTIEDADVEIPAGSAVFVPDPGTRRGAVALEDDTIVLAVGGWPGQAYHSLPWEPIYLAQESVRNGDWPRAAEILEAEAGEHIDRPIVRFRLACCHAQAGAEDTALEHLRRAIELDPDMRERAATEQLLEPLRRRDEFPGEGRS